MSRMIHQTTNQPFSIPANLGQLWPGLVEFALLAIIAPLFYFPTRVQKLVAHGCGCEAEWLLPLGIVVLALLWPLRRWLTGRWAAPVAMPVAVAIWFWFLVMLPVAIWAAPEPLREQYAWPRGAILA